MKKLIFIPLAIVAIACLIGASLPTGQKLTGEVTGRALDLNANPAKLTKADGSTGVITWTDTAVQILAAVTGLTGLSVDSGAVVFNETATDSDFRVEGDTDANLIMGDASTDRVGFGIAAPLGKVHVYMGASGATPNAAADEIVIEGSDHIGIQFLTPNTKTQSLYFGDPESNSVGYLSYAHSSNTATLGSSVAKLTGRVECNSGSADRDFYVYGDVKTLMFGEATSGAEGVSFGSSSAPDAMVDVDGSVVMTGLLNVNYGGPATTHSRIGDATASHVSTANDLFIEGGLETDGMTYADGGLTVDGKKVLVPHNQGITAVGDTISATYAHIRPDPSSNITLTSTPSIAAGTYDGQELQITMYDNDTLTIQDDSDLSGSNVFFEGGTGVTLSRWDVLVVVWNVAGGGAGYWTCKSYSNN